MSSPASVLRLPLCAKNSNYTVRKTTCLPVSCVLAEHQASSYEDVYSLVGRSVNSTDQYNRTAGKSDFYLLTRRRSFICLSDHRRSRKNTACYPYHQSDTPKSEVQHRSFSNKFSDLTERAAHILDPLMPSDVFGAGI